jgi:serine/threonine protein kinase
LLARGTILRGRYRIEAVRGCGGFGAVYRATDLQTGQTVAIKENQRHQTFQRFEQEGKLLMQLSHPNLPKVHEVFVDQTTGRAFLVMDFIDGETLEEMLERLKRPLTWQEAQPILAQVINALNHLHRNKVVHRDIKPSNIIVTKRNEKVHVFLVDFGVAKVMEEVDPKRPRSSSIVAWTDGYSPPEQYASGVQVDARADQYALAATMVFALTGKTPDDAFTRMAKFREGEPTLPPKPDGVPESVWKAIEVAMRFEPNYRFADVDEFLEAVSDQGKLPPEPPKAKTKVDVIKDAILVTIGGAIWGAIQGAILAAILVAKFGAIKGMIFGAIFMAILFAIVGTTMGAIFGAIFGTIIGAILGAIFGIVLSAIWGTTLGTIESAREGAIFGAISTAILEAIAIVSGSANEDTRKARGEG